MTLSGSISSFIAGLVHGRDPDLGDHHDRTQKITESLALLLEFPQDEVTLLGLGARIHDIGKLVINANLLLKPSRLTASEFEAVKAHSRLGAELLGPLILDPRIGDLVKHHHENYDGSGYPDNLVGDEIPRFAQVIRIVDSFDAITSDRPYHKGASVDEAIQIMKDDAVLFNPDYFKVFLEMMAGLQSGPGLSALRSVPS